MSGPLRMVVLVERDSPGSKIAVSRGWVVPEALFAELAQELSGRYGEPVQQGMRDLVTHADLFLGPA